MADDPGNRAEFWSMRAGHVALMHDRTQPEPHGHRSAVWNVWYAPPAKPSEARRTDRRIANRGEPSGTCVRELRVRDTLETLGLAARGTSLNGA